MSDTEITKKRGPQTRCYVGEDGFVLRTAGRADIIVPFVEIKAPVAERFIDEMVARLLLSGVAMVDIAAGKGIPDRAVPQPKAPKNKGPKPLNQVRRAIMAVRVAELIKAARGADEKIDRPAIQTKAEEWVRGLTDDQAARLARAEAVQIELAKLRGTKATLEDLLGTPTPPETEEAA
jgi:hypothetical protein